MKKTIWVNWEEHKIYDSVEALQDAYEAEHTSPTDFTDWINYNYSASDIYENRAVVEEQIEKEYAEAQRDWFDDWVEGTVEAVIIEV